MKTLPIADEAEPRKRALPILLVVDDNPRNIDVLIDIFDGVCATLASTGGAEALALVRSGRVLPDLILLDIDMPGLDGFAVCEALKGDPRVRHIPVIFVTAYTDAGHETRALGVGAVDFIVKPVVPAVALARVRTHLELAAHRNRLERLVAERTREVESTQLKVLSHLGTAGEYRDDETGNHVRRMSHAAEMIAAEAGWDDTHRQLMLHAAPMHDIGKIGIPDRILLKPGKLDADEWVVMRSHPVIGARIVGDGQSSPLMAMAREVAIAHHERWDGGGYPTGRGGESIPLPARIAAIADVFDALTSARPYKPAWSVDDAARHIEAQAGTHFDPALVACFLRRSEAVGRLREEHPDISVEDLAQRHRDRVGTPPAAGTRYELRADALPPGNGGAPAASSEAGTPTPAA